MKRLALLALTLTLVVAVAGDVALRPQIMQTANAATILNPYRFGGGAVTPPIVESVIADNSSTRVDTAVPDLPSGIQVGDLLLVSFILDAAASSVAHTGWFEQASGVLSSADRWYILSRIATGTDTLTVTWTTTRRWASIALRITNTSADGTQLPVTEGWQGGSTNIDPPSHTDPSGSDAYLWIAAGYHYSGSDYPVSDGPDGFENNTVEHASTGTTAMIATKQEVAVTVDPTTWTIPSARQQQAATMSIPPL